MLILPAIDLRDGRCVRLTQGRKDSTKVYDDDPIKMAQAFQLAGAQMLHVVDLDAASGVERIVYTDIERDGTLTGPNIDQTCMIAF